MNWVAKTERPQTVCLTRIKNDTPPQTVSRKHQELKEDLFKEHLWGAVLVFQLFKQFDLKIQCFISKFQKLFSHGIFKTVSLSCIFQSLKQMIFTFLEVFLREKLLYLLFSVRLFLFCWLVFAWFAFLCAQNLFVKINKYYWQSILLTSTPINPPIENLLVRTYFYLRESLIIYENLFESLIIYDRLCESILLTLLWK